MLPQPQVELRDRSRVLLDEMLGHGFCVAAYGPHAQQVATFAGRSITASQAFTPWRSCRASRIPDPDFAGPVETVRDHTGAFETVLPNGGLMLVRPDRHVAAVSSGEPEAMQAMAAAVKAMVGRTW